MTERLYYTDAYLTRFEARVVDRSDDDRRIYLDRSAFYPTSGGQLNDLGMLGGVAVVDVVDEDERVAHVLAAPLHDTYVEGAIDWTRRWDHMQQHTGQHLVSAIAADRFGWETVSVHFGSESSTIDFGTELIAPAALQTLERLANSAVTENHRVRVSFEEAASAGKLRKPSDREGTLRIVAIEQLDRSACGGTHVGATGEVGPILLRRVEKVRKTTRVEFLCGLRAVNRARSDFEILARLAAGSSCSIDELATVVPAQAEQLRALESERRRLEGEVSGYRAQALYDASTPGSDGIRRHVDRRATGKVDDARSLALAFAALPQSAIAVRVQHPPAILIAASDDSGIDAGKLLKGALTAAGGRGGGSPRLAQGTVPDEASLDTVLEALGFAIS